jgi:hypothetical protein
MCSQLKLSLIFIVDVARDSASLKCLAKKKLSALFKNSTARPTKVAQLWFQKLDHKLKEAAAVVIAAVVVAVVVVDSAAAVLAAVAVVVIAAVAVAAVIVVAVAAVVIAAVGAKSLAVLKKLPTGSFFYDEEVAWVQRSETQGIAVS